MIYYTKPSKGDQLTILIRFNRHGKRYNFTTGLKVPKKYWNTKTKSLKIETKEIREIDKKLNLLKEGLFLFLMEERTKDEIRAKIKQLLGQKKDLWNQAWDEYLEIIKQKASYKTTWSKYNSIRDHSKTAMDQKKLKLDFSRVDITFFEILNNYFLDLNYSPNTVSRLVSALKSFMRWSKAKGYHNQSSFELFRSNSARIRITYLNGDELRMFSEFIFDDPKLDRVRDLFCFACYTGLRFVDLGRISTDNIKGNELHITARKDQDELEIPLSSKALRILLKYGNKLPSITNQRANEYLREAAKKAELKREILTTSFKRYKKVDLSNKLHDVISMHMARRTFVTLMFAQGLPAETIMTFTGHSDLKAMKPYLETLTKESKQALKLALGNF